VLVGVVALYSRGGTLVGGGLATLVGGGLATLVGGGLARGV
jgi:hypothetical protein